MNVKDYVCTPMNNPVMSRERKRLTHTRASALWHQVFGSTVHGSDHLSLLEQAFRSQCTTFTLLPENAQSILSVKTILSMMPYLSVPQLSRLDTAASQEAFLDRPLDRFPGLIFYRIRGSDTTPSNDMQVTDAAIDTLTLTAGINAGYSYVRPNGITGQIWAAAGMHR